MNLRYFAFLIPAFALMCDKQMRITSVPNEATIILKDNGKVLGKTPLEMESPLTGEIVLRKKDYKDVELFLGVDRYKYHAVLEESSIVKNWETEFFIGEWHIRYDSGIRPNEILNTPNETLVFHENGSVCGIESYAYENKCSARWKINNDTLIIEEIHEITVKIYLRDKSKESFEGIFFGMKEPAFRVTIWRMPH